ncbi:hypothetical protein KZX47_12795 [Thermus sp. SYSU G05001]|uniref:Uncharacterized protein n=1 Tax=Thermus brevis TaxID=2862456 RepID=A0ABS7A146_9DEIN|nr:hypothetical protein [Thermus brevis]MBW6396022.1 hypothetical protein [Thermus brevis]
MAAPTREHRQRLQEAAYLLRIREGGKPHPVPGHPVAGRDGVFPLPLPPQAVRGEQPARLGYMPARAWAVVDVQGLEAPTWEIEGQFLLTPRSVRGVRLDAYGWTRALEEFVRYFLEENRQRGQAKKPLLTLEWHDFYRDEHWEVAPRLVPLAAQSAAQPLVERWSLRLQGVKPVGAPPKPEDRVKQSLFEADPNRLVAEVCPVEGGYAAA